MSACSPAATAPSDLPVAGLMLSKVAPLAAGANRPSMKTWERGLSAARRARAIRVAEMGGCAGMANTVQKVGGVEAEMISQTSRPTLRKRCGVALEK